MSRLKLPLYAVGVFLLGVVSGALAYPRVEDSLPLIVEKIFKGILVPSSKFKTALNIIERNAAATLILILSGLTVVIPFLIVYVNGFLAGLAVTYVTVGGLNLPTMLKGIIPHGVPELTAFFWSAGLAFGIGLKVVDGVHNKKSKQVISALKDSLKTYVKFILPLIAVAGFIEVYVSASLVGVGS